MSPRDEALLLRLRDQLFAALDTVVSGTNSALLAFPNHRNVGDNAIWLGERAWMRSRGIRPVYTCTRAEYAPDTLRLAAPDTVLFHGGGNFGDLWAHEHEFRLRVIADSHGIPILQMSTSMHFDSAESLARTRDVLGEHGHVTILVRDPYSYSVARTLQDEALIRLVPDMAHGLTPMIPRPAGSGMVFLARDDHEANVMEHGSTELVPVDWQKGDIPGVISDSPVRVLEKRLKQGLERRLSQSPLRSAVRFAAKLRIAQYDRKAEARLARGMHLLGTGDVITDRLHGHLLAILSGGSSIALPDANGKVHNYHNAWLAELEGARTADSLAAALENLSDRR